MRTCRFRRHRAADDRRTCLLLPTVRHNASPADPSGYPVTAAAFAWSNPGESQRFSLGSLQGSLRLRHGEPCENRVRSMRRSVSQRRPRRRWRYVA